MCLLDKDEPRKELPNLVSDEVPRNPIFGDGTLPYRSMDCLKFKSHHDNNDFTFDAHNFGSEFGQK